MVRGKFFSGQDDLSIIKEIRRQVMQEEDDGQDDFCMHVLAYDGDIPVATGRISFDGWEFVISKVCVLKEHQGKMYGDFVVRMLVDKAMMSNAQQVKLEATKDTTAFFEKIGFKLSEAEGYKMTLNTDSIHKCCNCK